MRILLIAILAGSGLWACGKQDKPADSPERDDEPAAAEPAEPTRPAPTPAPAAGSGASTLTPDQVRRDVERAGAEHTDKIDKAMDVE